MVYSGKSYENWLFGGTLILGKWRKVIWFGKRGGSKPIEANRPKTRPEVEALQKNREKPSFCNAICFLCDLHFVLQVNILQSWRAWLQDYMACKHVSFWQEAMSEVQLSSNSIAPVTDWTQIVNRKYHWKRFLLQWGKKIWETSIPQCLWGQLKYAKIWSVWNGSSATLIATRNPSGWQITAGSTKLHFLSNAYHRSLEQDGLLSISRCFSFFPQILLFLLCYFWWFGPWTWSNLPSAWVVQAALHLNGAATEDAAAVSMPGM